MPKTTSRIIEDLLVIVGMFQAVFYGSIEALDHGGFIKSACTTHSEIPWMTMTIFLGCVLPKTLGRMTAGKIWQTLSDKISIKTP